MIALARSWPEAFGHRLLGEPGGPPEIVVDKWRIKSETRGVNVSRDSGANRHDHFRAGQGAGWHRALGGREPTSSRAGPSRVFCPPGALHAQPRVQRPHALRLDHQPLPRVRVWL